MNNIKFCEFSKSREQALSVIRIMQPDFYPLSTMIPSNDAYFAANKALWNAKTPIHVDTEMYDMAAFRAGQSSLRSIELEGLGEVAGKSILHLQCHFGQDSLSWAREGAQVTGVDLSDAAIDQARALSRELNIPAEFICCNVYDLKDHLKGKFDIVFTSYGTIGWLPDLDPWAEVISHFLKPGGTFFIADFHPVVWMMDDDFKEFTYSYFNKGVIEEEVSGTYADRDADIQMLSYGWNHPLSEIITALIGKRLEIRDLSEYDYSPWACFPHLKQIDERKWIFEHLEHKIPYVYSIKAQKPTS